MRSPPLIADLHLHLLLHMRYGRIDPARRHRPPRFWNLLRHQLDLPRLKEAGYRVCVLAMYAPLRLPPWRSWAAELMLQERLAEEAACASGGWAVRVRGREELKAALAGGRAALITAVEGGHHLRSPGDAALLERLGVLYLTLVHFRANRLGTSCLSRRHARRGLTGFGRELLGELRRARVVPDLAHASERLMEDVLREDEGPVMVSHTGSRRRADIPRNVPEWAAREIIRRGGLLGVTYHTHYLRRPRPYGGVELITGAIEDFLELGGEESVCIGSDLDGGILCPAGLKDVAGTSRLVEALRRRFPEPLVRKLLGENVLRFLEQHWR